MTEHSILSPSSFPRLVACPGSRQLEVMFPREESEAAAEGILAHELAAKCLKKYFSSDEEFIYSIGNFSMDEYLNIYIDHVASKVRKNEKPNIENLIDIPYLHPDCFGTPDCWYYDEEKNEIHVWDFKYGFKPVEVRENWQLIGYASGVCNIILEKFHDGNKFLSEHWDIVINLHIVQPRARHKDGQIRTWSLTRDAFRYYEDELRTSIQASFLENPLLEVGSHCTYCKAKSICPQLKKESNMIVDKELEIERELKSPSIEGAIVYKDYIDVNSSTDKKTIKPKYSGIFDSNGLMECNGEKITREDMPGLFSALDSCLEKEHKEEGKKILLDKIKNIVHEKIDSGEISIDDNEESNNNKFNFSLPKKTGILGQISVDGKWMDPLSHEITETKRSIEILRLRLETLEKKALEKIQEGKEVPGFSAKKVWGRLGWNIPVKDVQMLGNELGLTLAKPYKLDVITPIQAMKLAKKDEAIKERIKSLASCKFNGYKLVAEGDSSDDEEVNFDDL